MIINKDKKGEIKIFTRRLDNVTNQFPDVVNYIREIKLDTFILDGEAVGFDPKTKKFKPFEAISQRIKRKYNIDELIKKLPIELNLFDILYLNGESLLNKPFKMRSEILRKHIHSIPYKLKTSEQIITSSEKDAARFYQMALKNNQEGVMIKNLESPYKPGARVGDMLKLKPAENELDLVITGAEYGKGKRAGFYSTFILSCYDEKNDKFLEIGKSSGLKEKESEGLSFKELTEKLHSQIIEEKGRSVILKPKIVVTIIYQNIQRSPTYSSGFALRFPRIIRLRPDKGIKTSSTLSEIIHDYNRHELKIKY